jgi:aminopeptidase N
MRRLFGRGAGVVLAATALGLAPAAAWAGIDTTGTPGLDPVPDSFFPKSGNGGYDVSHYDVTLNYDPKTNKFKSGTHTVIDAEVTQPDGLSRFDLDYRGPEITDLEVTDDGSPVPTDFKRKGQELIVSFGAVVPKAGAGSFDGVVPNGDEMSIDVAYKGKPPELTDPDKSLEGWSPTKDGAFVVGEPRGTPAWMPSNDHPTDKATFELHATVPSSRFVVSNGVLDNAEPKGGGDKMIYDWFEDEPMATYLATATVGRFDVDEESLSGAPSYSLIAVDKSSERGAVDRSAEIVDFLDDTLGTYPFSAVGGIVDKARRVGYALETQTRPIYNSPPTHPLVAHELAHQWVGDNITLNDWSQIWLNEGFATYAQWAWVEAQGGQTLVDRVNEYCDIPASEKGFWNPPPASVPGPEVMFDGTVYDRGGMTLERLRELIGDTDFSASLDDWLAQDREGAYDTDDFIAIVKDNTETPDAELDDFFHDWLVAKGKPNGCAAAKGTLEAALGVPKLAGLR